MRVHLKTKNKGVKVATYHCRKCSEPIKAGEKYYEWKHKHAAPSRQHASHGSPRTSELVTGKMSGVYAAIETVEDVIAVGRAAMSVEDLGAALENAADEVRNVASEYEDGLSNMPDGLQQSSTGEAIQEKIDALNEFADSLESAASDSEISDWDSDEDEPDEPEVMDEHAETCPVSVAVEKGEAADAIECNCGYESLQDEHNAWEVDYETWYSEREERIEAALDYAESALQELSI